MSTTPYSLSLEDAVQTGMTIAWQAARFPAASAVVSNYGERSFSDLNANANRLVRCLREGGLVAGDSVAIVAKNRPEFVEVLAATMRSGLRLTPINYHLKGEEIGYVVDNCDAKAFIADATLGDAPVEALTHAPGVRLALSVGGDLAGYESYAAAISPFTGDNIDDPSLGARMLYTSGTTGRPKGVFRKDRLPEVPQGEDSLNGYRAGQDRALVTGPGYHAAPLLIDIVTPLISGVGIVMMDKWDAEQTLRLIDRHCITHTHMVATMFHRLLQLPEAVREQYDVSSLRRLVHGAAPCPVHVKRSMIEWLGPVLYEFYGGTEGGGCTISSAEWLARPGSVGRPFPHLELSIFDDEGRSVATGVEGEVWFRQPGEFTYKDDPDKTAAAVRNGLMTLGDIGYVDDEGYLFLCDRRADVIVSGGVNIYPAQIEAALAGFPGLADCCVVGAPDDEWGEMVVAVVEPVEGVELDPEALRAFAAGRLARYQVPRRIDLVGSLPRTETGKLARRAVRNPYWSGRERRI